MVAAEYREYEREYLTSRIRFRWQSSDEIRKLDSSGNAEAREQATHFFFERLGAKPQQRGIFPRVKVAQKWTKIEAIASSRKAEICPVEDGWRGGF